MINKQLIHQLAAQTVGWNSRYPIGTPIEAKLDDGSTLKGKTSCAALVKGGAAAVIRIVGHANPIPLNQIKALIPEAVIAQRIPLAAIPRDQWPLAARVLAKFAIEQDTGLGDVIARKLGGGGIIFKRWYKKLTGRDCGCSDRQRRLNEMYPLRPLMSDAIASAGDQAPM